MKGTCRYCGCTKDHGCEGGCSWADEDETLCTRCELAMTFAASTLPVMVALAEKAPAHAKDWDGLGLLHQTALVKAFRMLSDAVSTHFMEQLGDEVFNAAMDLSILAQMLYQKFPEEMKKADAEGEPAMSVALELLGRVSQTRIVLPH